MIVCLICTAWINNDSTYSNKKVRVKLRLDEKALVLKNNCTLLKDDRPPKLFYTFKSKTKYRFANYTAYELLLGSEEQNTTSQLFLGINDLKDSICVFEKRNDATRKLLFCTINDTASRQLNCRKLDAYIIKLDTSYIVSNDHIYQISLRVKSPVILHSDMRFFPIKELVFSSINGITRVIIDNNCYRAVYR